jgi:hypothetical protein
MSRCKSRACQSRGKKKQTTSIKQQREKKTADKTRMMNALMLKPSELKQNKKKIKSTKQQRK